MRIISQLPRKRLVFYILLLITASFIESIHAGQLNRSECKFAAAWFEHNIKSTPKEPFSFRYGRQASNELITDWNREIKLLGSQNQRSEYKIVYSDPLGKLRLVLHADVYTDFPAVEWVLELENCGADTTEIFDNILVADLLLSALKSESVILHHATGSDHRIDDFAPLTTIIQPGQQVRMAPKGGRSSDETAFPFFNVEQDNQGVGVGIGWTGQWAAELDRNANGTLTLQVGMERTHLRLYSGEKIRTPRILLLFWQGSDRMRGHNLMRQFMLAHHTPQI